MIDKEYELKVESRVAQSNLKEILSKKPRMKNKSEHATAQTPRKGSGHNHNQ